MTLEPRPGDRLYEAYDDMGDAFVRRAFGSPWNRLYDQPVVRSLLPPVAGKTVLDAGCGPGAYFAWLLDGGAEVVAFDASAEMVRVARERHGDDVDLRIHDLAEPLDFVADDSIDVVLCALMIHYLEEPVAALREFRRVLKPSGCVVISDQHPFADWLRLGGSYFERTLETELWRGEDGDFPVSFWRRPLTDTCADFSDAGFVIDRLVEHRPGAEFAAAEPEEHRDLSLRPAFIAFRLVPRPAP